MSLSHLATTTIPSRLNKNPLVSSRTNKSQRVHLANKRVSHISCSSNEQQKPIKNGAADGSNIDRRNVLLGLGGMYGAATTIGNPGNAGAAGTTSTQQVPDYYNTPIAVPDLTKCHLADDGGTKFKCCPPYMKDNPTIKPYVPTTGAPLRVRKAAHLLTPAEIDKFEAAVTAMKNLPADDPWNFLQQATIHCTYCNGAFTDAATNNPLQIHGSWFFLPWHRAYLYFWERILGKLCNDDTFAIPYWNWDGTNPKGMYMPEIYYSNRQSSLYDDLRDHTHYEAFFDYNLPALPPTTPEEIDEATTSNLCRLHRIFREAKNLPYLFMGKPIKGTQDRAGSCELLHNNAHQWVGTTSYRNADMGNFATAARDTIFFAHHGNIDRLWDVLTKSRNDEPEFGEGAVGWLDSEFLFYDENREFVKIKVRDTLTTEKLGYRYESETPNTWDKDPLLCRKKLQNDAKKRKIYQAAHPFEIPTPVVPFDPEVDSNLFSQPLQATLTRTPTVKNAKVSEVLLIEGLQVTSNQSKRVDVYVRKPEDKDELSANGTYYGELAGSLVMVGHGEVDPSSSHMGKPHTLMMGITSLLEDIDGQQSDKIVVTLVPGPGEDARLTGFKIELINHADHDKDALSSGTK